MALQQTPREIYFNAQFNLLKDNILLKTKNLGYSNALLAGSNDKNLAPEFMHASKKILLFICDKNDSRMSAYNMAIANSITDVFGDYNTKLLNGNSPFKDLNFMRYFIENMDKTDPGKNEYNARSPIKGFFTEIINNIELRVKDIFKEAKKSGKPDNDDKYEFHGSKSALAISDIQIFNNELNLLADLNAGQNDIKLKNLVLDPLAYTTFILSTGKFKERLKNCID